MKNKKEEIVITPELISKFVAGKTSMEEWLTVQAAIRENPDIREIVTASLQINSKMNEVELSDNDGFKQSDSGHRGRGGRGFRAVRH